jgi:hypothetical protein
MLALALPGLLAFLDLLVDVGQTSCSAMVGNLANARDDSLPTQLLRQGQYNGMDRPLACQQQLDGGRTTVAKGMETALAGQGIHWAATSP